MTTNTEKWPFFGRPPTRPPKPARDVPALRGKRVILSTPEGFIYDMRAATNIEQQGGRATVEIVSDIGWYRWMLVGQQPHTEPYPVRLVWVE